MRGLIAALRRRLRAEGGFVLTEMLVAAALGTVTLLVVAEFVDSTQNASSRVVARVDSTQRGRAAMEAVTQRLRSQVCVGPLTPVTRGDDNSVELYTELGGEDFAPERRRISVVGGNLREEVYESTGVPPEVTFPETPTGTRVLAEDVRPVRSGDTGTVPFFQFFGFDAGNPARPVRPLATPLSEADLAQVVSVKVSFRARAANTDENVDSNFANTVNSRYGNPMEPDPLKRGPQCS